MEEKGMNELISFIQTDNGEHKLIRNKCKTLKDEINEMIKILRLDDVELLENIKAAIIDAQADYYYSILIDKVKN
jgi:hypothetical protein